VSSQDGSNRSQRPPRTSQQPRHADASQRPDQTWDVDPAEIDRYLSGRPTRSEETSSRPDRGRSGGSTADQISRLQGAVNRRRTPQQADSTISRQTFRPESDTSRSRSARSQQPDPVQYDDEYAYTGAEDRPDRETYAGYDDDVAYDETAYAYDDGDDRDARAAAHRPRSRTARVPASRTAQQRPVRRQDPEPIDVYDEADYEDELYNDDPYLGYEDDEIDRRPPRAPRRQRSRPSISKPNLPTITLPKSVTNSPLLADMGSLVMIGLAILSVALMAFVVSDRITILGDTIPTHVSASGDPENIRTSEAIWNIPLMAGMVMLMNIGASWFISTIDRFASRFVLASGLLVHFIAWVALFKYLWD
jgi:hypothetical protein